MPDWKKTERQVDSIIGGCRIPVMGRARGDTPDIRHDWLCPEVKHRKTIPFWLVDALTQARAAAREDQLPIAVLHQHGWRHTDDLVVLRMSDFVAYFADNASVRANVEGSGSAYLQV